MTRVTFDPAAINVYVDDWRVTPKSQAQEAA
jgi:glycerol transport system ATP-binding protein